MNKQRLVSISRYLVNWSPIRPRVPVIHQLSVVECGAACLAMILGFHGRKTTVSEIREFCSLGRDGLSGLTIVKVARGYGLRAKAYSVEPDQLKYLCLPAIIHWGFNHFVVLESWSPRRIEVIDPGQGRQQVTHEEFKEEFTGVVLTFEPGKQFRSNQSRRGTVSLWAYFMMMFSNSAAKGLIAQVLLTSLLLQILGLILPIFTKVIVDNVFPDRGGELLKIIGIAMIVMVFSQVIASYLRNLCLVYLRGHLECHLMLGFVEHLFSLPYKFFQERTTGDLLMRLTGLSHLREVLTSQTLAFILDGAFMIVYLNLLLFVLPWFGLLVLLIALLQVAVLIMTGQRIYNLAQRELAAGAEEKSYLIEAINGITLLKATGAEDRVFDSWSNHLFKQLNISLERSRLSALAETVFLGLRTLAPVLLLWLGAYYVIEKEMSVGMMLAVNALAATCLAPVTSLISSGQQLHVINAHLERLSDVFEACPEQTPGAGRSAHRLTGRVELRDVNYQYSRESTFALKNISCVIKPGQKVAIVGATGSGKSTLALLLLGLLQPTDGEIYYDDSPIREIDYRSLRSQFGIVLQDPVIFSGSIRQNIIFGNPNVGLDVVIEAASEACLHDEIVAMPMGYETVISEGGTNLSGGQRQRLALARALAGRPAILLLDEATSHLDGITEAAVDRKLSSLSCTRIVIAHRLSTICNADQILVLKGGEIVERGKQEELLKNGCYYCELLQYQSNSAVTN
ncbi:MAG: peptidase domain-containing ABC transporter [Acidobacteria bacterium]|nr:peptidase domain-containing ABC transporter [Acidobacteriota bacterium]